MGQREEEDLGQKCLPVQSRCFPIPQKAKQKKKKNLSPLTNCPSDVCLWSVSLLLHLATIFYVCSEPLGAKEFGLQLLQGSLVSWYKEVINKAIKHRVNEKDT